jgi:hypothetical protein
MFRIPVLLNHDRNKLIGRVTAEDDDGLIVELEVTMTKEQLFKTFGDAGMVVLESTFDLTGDLTGDTGQIEFVRKLKIYEFSLCVTGQGVR